MHRPTLAPASRAPPTTVALRALIKYMSRVLGIGYKEIANATHTNESAVKNYVNDKSTTAPKAGGAYTALFTACASLVADERGRRAPDPFLIGALTHLFGSDWVHSKGIRVAAGPSLDEPLDGRWDAGRTRPQPNTKEVEVALRGLWRIVRASTPAIPQPCRAGRAVRAQGHQLLAA